MLSGTLVTTVVPFAATSTRGIVPRTKAVAAGVSISTRERLYLDALDAQYRDGPGGGLKAAVSALDKLVQEYPEDLDAKAWLAMTIWQSGSITSRESVEALIATLLDRALEARKRDAALDALREEGLLEPQALAEADPAEPPTEEIFPSSMTIIWSDRPGDPVPSMIRT